MDAAPPPAPESDDDPAAAAGRPALVSAAAVALGVEGLLVALLGLQNLTLVQWHPPYDKLVHGLILLGAVTIGAAVAVSRVGLRRHGLAIALAGLLVAVTLAWLGWSFWSGVLSPLAVAVVTGAVVALVLLAVSLPHCRRTALARAALEREGIQFNL